MNKNIYRQYDSRWGSLPYPSRPYTVARSGCGLCSVTHCVIEIPKYKNYTPKTIRPFMVKYATRGNGTLWSGITAGLKHYGYSVAEPNVNKSMNGAWSYLNKKDALKRGVILFGRQLGGSSRVRWTGGGHYVAFIDYKYENGKHWFYTKDSGSRKHDGWYSYEGAMRGAIHHIFICTSVKGDKPTPKPTGKYDGRLPNPTLKKGSGGTRVVKLQKFLNWYLKINLATDGNLGPKTEAALIKFQANEGLVPDGVYGPKTYAKAKSYL